MPAPLKELQAEHGPIEHIVLGTVGLEHKALAGPFARAFPEATCWLQPGQWSFPVPFALELLGFPGAGRLKWLPTPGSGSGGGGGSGSSGSRAGRGSSATEPATVAAAAASSAGAMPPWADEISFEVLGPLRFKAVGAFGETAFIHHATETLLVTDTILKVEDEPPAIIAEDPRSLLYHARDSIAEEVRNTAEVRRKGWRRVSQFGLLFFPSSIEVRTSEVIDDAKRLPDSMRALGEGAVPVGLFPWEWARDDRPSFKRLRNGGLLCAPILQALILNRFPDETREWVDRVGAYSFRRIIPCHFANDIKATPADFSCARSPSWTRRRTSSAPRATTAARRRRPGRPPAAGSAAAAASAGSATSAAFWASPTWAIRRG